MLVPSDSPLRNLPLSMPQIQRVALDGLRYAADMVGLSADRLHMELASVSAAPTQRKVGAESFTACFADAWAVVDNLWRLNLLLRRVPGLKRTPEIEAHLRALARVEALRHGYQHLDNQVRVCADGQRPLWGSISWVFFPDGLSTVGSVFVMIPGSLGPGTNPMVNPAGLRITAPIDHITLTAFGQELRLSALLHRVAILIQQLDGGLRSATAGQDAAGADVLISVEFVPTPSA